VRGEWAADTGSGSINPDDEQCRETKLVQQPPQPVNGTTNPPSQMIVGMTRNCWW